MSMVEYVYKCGRENVLAIIATLFLFVFILTKTLKRNHLRLPPGPKGLPIVGYLPYLGLKPYKLFMELQKKYGNVIGLKLGGHFTVVLSDISSIKEAFSKNDFSARPDGLFKFNNKYENLVNMRGKQWIEHTRFSKTLLRDLGMGKERIENIIKEQVARVISKLEGLKPPENEILLSELLSLSADNVIFYMICNKIYPDGDPTARILHEYQVHSLRYFACTSLAAYFPFLKPFLLKFHPNLKRTKRAITNMENLLHSEIMNHEKNLDPNYPVDFIDHFLIQIEKKQRQDGFTKDILNGTSQFFMLGGSETGRVSLEWALLLLAKYQDVQEKAYKEIVEVLGTENQVSWKDRDSLPYNHAMLMEVQRRKTIVPLSVTRCAQKDTKIWDYDIPKETIVLANLWGVHMNPDYWPEPKKFDPTRFLSPDGKTVKHSDCLIPFSYGQRMCPAEKMGTMQLFISLTTLIQRFKFLPPNDGLDFSQSVALTYCPKNSRVKVVTRR